MRILFPAGLPASLKLCNPQTGFDVESRNGSRQQLEGLLIFFIASLPGWAVAEAD